ncbi:MAG: winged helix-turn-helix transcriptional regulator [Solirubrobacteraceae bacterium]
MRELLLGPKRYTDLRRGLPGASPNVLSQRLRELESGGVIRRRQLPPPAASRVYELTDWAVTSTRSCSHSEAGPRARQRRCPTLRSCRWIR